jgi:hypothetical protein
MIGTQPSLAKVAIHPMHRPNHNAIAACSASYFDHKVEQAENCRRKTHATEQAPVSVCRGLEAAGSGHDWDTLPSTIDG